jgi:Ser-tRNA(Ala) deacylase AlaX
MLVKKMTTQKIFWENPYLTELNAQITNIENNTLTLDKTIFYAFSGGQESDSGTIDGRRVLKAEKIDREIFYTLDSVEGLDRGDYVLVKIDWAKRYRIMRLHFAAEIILELVYQNYDRPQKIGANITSEKARLDFLWKGNISDTFIDLLGKARKIIDSDLEIISRFSDIENERRYWEIQNFARVSCGGTHLKRTSEVGKISLKRKSIGSGKERIEIYLDN